VSLSPAPYGTNSAYLDLETGEIFYQSEMADIDDIGDEELAWDHMIAILHKNDLDLGRSLVFEFVEITVPDAYGQIRQCSDERGLKVASNVSCIRRTLLESLVPV
jgi:hypothetical protein